MSDHYYIISRWKNPEGLIWKIARQSISNELVIIDHKDSVLGYMVENFIEIEKRLFEIGFRKIPT